VVSLVSLVQGSSVRVRVPASSANIGPGFDSIGLALGIWDECVVTVSAEPGLRVEVGGEGAGEVPRDELNLIYRSMVQAWQRLNVQTPAGLNLSCHNAVPQCRGLGSSATSIVKVIQAVPPPESFTDCVFTPVTFIFSFANNSEMSRSSPCRSAASTITRKPITVGSEGARDLAVSVGGDKRPSPFVPDKYGHKRQPQLGY